MEESAAYFLKSSLEINYLCFMVGEAMSVGERGREGNGDKQYE